MISASVGFQCPECFHEGKKSVREARTSYGGLIPTGLSVSIILVAINVAIWLLIQLTGGETSRITEWIGLMPNGECTVPGGYYPGLTEQVCASGPDTTWVPGVADGAVWRLVTSIFTQVGFIHLFFNVFNIWVLGPQLEAAFGRARFLAIYLLAGLSGSIAVYWLGPVDGLTIGASGAVFGLLGALLVMAVRTRQPPQGILFWIGLSLVYSFVVTGISWQAHVGGLIGGALIAAAFVWIPRGPRRRTLQWGSVGAMLAVLVVLAVVRTLTLTA
ncbi:rhomboid family intramembrane serine protease [Nocardioides sp.]|jgi:membrane associated rhomboid family serine protease|uniref:rhomboid family intramembrane serine protease n=1 Tax=Nocardioides sp. TaxID=35761 RepID=UPI00263341D2|nr:rhomboid family intramembrane serine protease [Nocardioides sp.]